MGMIKGGIFRNYIHIHYNDAAFDTGISMSDNRDETICQFFD